MPPSLHSARRKNLRLLIHAMHCQADPCAATPLCAETRTLYAHARSCHASGCRVSNCVRSRALLRHYARCKRGTCLICKPVRIWAARQGVEVLLPMMAALNM